MYKYPRCTGVSYFKSLCFFAGRGKIMTIIFAVRASYCPYPHPPLHPDSHPTPDLNPHPNVNRVSPVIRYRRFHSRVYGGAASRHWAMLLLIPWLWLTITFSVPLPSTNSCSTLDLTWINRDTHFIIHDQSEMITCSWFTIESFCEHHSWTTW